MCLVLDHPAVEEAEALLGGDNHNLPAPFLCGCNELADIAGDPGRAHDDIHERIALRRIHAGTVLPVDR